MLGKMLFAVQTGRIFIFMAAWMLLTAAGYASDEAGMDKPSGLQLTWQYDPATTMTIDWHVEESHSNDHILRYRKLGDDVWLSVEAGQFGFPYSDRIIHRVELTELRPATTYEFRAGSFPRVYQFRTVQEDLADHPLIFATGGDTRHNKEWMLNTNRAVMQYDLDFIVWGGDLAYADGRPDRLYRWYEWFEANYESLITEEGRVIPVIAGIGNHEVLSRYYFNSHRLTWLPEYEQNDASRKMIAPYYYALFAFPGQPGYATLDFGNYLSILMLDTDHSNPIEGVQTDWLEKELRERARRKVTHVFPVYHVPAYPSHRDYNGAINTRVRNNWVPLFEKYGVRAAFENHDHTYKRTHPIRNGAIAEDGIVYIGDGAWGVNHRVGNSRDAWYINRFESVRHGIIVTLTDDKQHYEVVNEDGALIDTYTIQIR